ncbi:hypothetical protein AAC387_Pa02g2141 [Persea americana]
MQNPCNYPISVPKVVQLAKCKAVYTVPAGQHCAHAMHSVQWLALGTAVYSGSWPVLCTAGPAGSRLLCTAVCWPVASATAVRSWWVPAMWDAL